MLQGLVIKNTGSRYIVLDDVTGEQIVCAIKGNFRIKGLRTTNPVAVGDHVEIMLPKNTVDGSAYITRIDKRKNYIIRKASNLSKEAHILAANLDQALLVVTLFHPVTSTTFIDRFLATCEAYNVDAVIAVNKIDLLDTDEEREYLQGFCYLYESIGYKVFPISALNNKGIYKLRDQLIGKTTLLSGNSGVGKTSVINRLMPGLDLKTSEISDVHDTGIHTTTFSEMFRLPEGGWLIDTPGVKGFGTIEMDKREVDHFFPEIFRISADCRFRDCSHTGEPGCAVKEALDQSLVSQSRYNSYLSILEDALQGDSNNKYRKSF